MPAAPSGGTSKPPSQGVVLRLYMGDCQNYGPFLGPYYNTGPNTGPNLGDPKRDHNFDNPPYHSDSEITSSDTFQAGLHKQSLP